MADAVPISDVAAYVADEALAAAFVAWQRPLARLAYLMCGDVSVAEEVVVELVNAAGNVASNLGTPLAVSTDGRYALFTVAQVSSGNVLHVVDATTLRDVSAISRAAYANAFLLPKDRANFIPIPAPGEEGYGWPVAPQGFGTWTTDVVVLGATGAVITFGVDGGVLHPGVTIPIDPLAVAGATTVNVVGTWAGASGRSVNLAVRMSRTGVAILTCTVDSCSPADPSITEPPLPNVS